MIKRLLLIVSLLLIPIAAYCAPAKYALVIGNGNYTNITKLNNPVNDANDMAATLTSMGFKVDKLLNVSRSEMERGFVQLRDNLMASKDSYGFVFYAGHGVQSRGRNYLIPVNADIVDREALPELAVSMQTQLERLNGAGNALNIFVLDACRDNPFSWNRGSNRGLAMVSAPADSIIMYATAAGSTASDGTGRNGLFTSYLLKHLKTPGLYADEIFRRTGAEISVATGKRQIPALYSMSHEQTCLGNLPCGGKNASTVVYAQFDSGYLSDADEYERQIAAYNRFIARDPDNASLYNDRGNIYNSRREHDEAIADYDQAINIDSNSAILYYNRGYAYYGKFGDGDRISAHADFTKAIQLEPNFADSYERRAWLYYLDDQYDDAIADYSKNIQLSPYNDHAYKYRGLSYYNKNEYDKAIADFTASIQRAQGANERIYYNLYTIRGKAYLAKGEYSKARADAESALKLYSGDDNAKDLLRFIGNRK
jgi:tetratricopeptide (TPR) repeat protein